MAEAAWEGPSKEEYEALVSEVRRLHETAARKGAGGGRCPFPVKHEGKKDTRCIVPLVEGKHTDGNPLHYAGSSHWTNLGWVRG